MTVKELVERISFQDIPIFFHTDRESKQLFNTRILTAEELRHFRKPVGEDKPLEDKPLGVYLLNLPINDVYELFATKNAKDISVIEELIKRKTPDQAYSDMKYTIILFMILHEIGHWKHFIDSGMNGIDYWTHFGVPEDNFIKQFYCLLYYQTDEKSEIMSKFAVEYRKLPMEKAADEYALRTMIPFLLNDRG